MGSPGMAVVLASSLSMVNSAEPVNEYSTLSLLLMLTGSNPVAVALATLTTFPSAPNSVEMATLNTAREPTPRSTCADKALPLTGPGVAQEPVPII